MRQYLKPQLRLKWIIAFLTFSDPSNHLGSYEVSLIAFLIWANSNHILPTFLWGRAAYFRISRMQLCLFRIRRSRFFSFFSVVRHDSLGI